MYEQEKEILYLILLSNHLMLRILPYNEPNCLKLEYLYKLLVRLIIELLLLKLNICSTLIVKIVCLFI